MEKQHPKVGVGVFVFKNGKILMGQRKNTGHGVGCWGLPGGHLEFGEEIKDCAEREVMEEAGIKIKNIRFGPYTNDIFKKDGKHYLALFVISDYDSGEVINREPDKLNGWSWIDWADLPRPLFAPVENFIKSGYSPFSY